VENPRYDDARPLGVLTVANADDVAAGLTFAHDNGLPVAIRSGGHSYPGWSAGGGGQTGQPRALVLDCRRLAEVSVDNETATIGSGASLARVYDGLGRRGRAIGGGSCATVGFGGLTLGGGVGVLTRDFGLTCDSVIAMQVVTAEGNIKTVNHNDDPDLFWALCGGGPGTAVVTQFNLATRPSPAIQTVYLSWPISAVDEVVPAWQDWAPNADPRLWSTLKALGGELHQDGPILQLSGTWTGPPGSFAKQLDGLRKNVQAPSVSATHAHDYLDAMMTYAGCANTPTSRCHTGIGGALVREAFAATSHIAYDVLPGAGVSALTEQVQAAQSSGLKEAGISMDALGGNVGLLAPDATAFVHRKALMTIQYTGTYTTGPAKAADDYVRGFRNAMSPYWGEHAYVNYADATLRDEDYFGANTPRLHHIRDTYDPDGILSG
jgi:FAD/FMN-containing dehydrogenase